MNFLKKSLLTKLVVSYFILSAITVVAIAITTNVRARESLTESVFYRLKVATSLKEYQLNYWMQEQKQELFLLSQFADIQEQVAILVQKNKNTPEYQQAYIKLNNYFLKIRELKPQMDDISILTPGGIVIVSTNKSEVGNYVPLGNWVTFLTNTNNLFVLPNFYTSRITGQPKMTFATSIDDAKGKRMAVIAIDLNLHEIDQLIRERTGLGESGETYLVGRLEDKTSFISFAQQGKDKTIKDVQSEGIDAALVGKSGQGLYKNYAGVPVVGVYHKLQQQNLVILAEISQAEAFAPANRLSKDILLLGLSSAALLLVAVYLLSRRITQPILAIVNTAMNVSSGNMKAKAPVMTEDEIGAMARAFNQMTQQIRDYFSNLEAKNTLLENIKKELAENNATLEEKVQARTAELENSIEEVRAAKAEAESANQTKSTFLANMSHELRTPLNAIIGYSEMLIEESQELEPEEFVPDLEKIYRSGKLLLNLINDILDLSKVEAGKMELFLEDFCINTMIEDVIITIEPLVAKNKNTLVNNCPKDIGTMYADVTRIRQILLNLLSNACKFSNNGIIHLNVKRCSEPDKDWILLQVKDSGIGMTAEQIDKLFQPFSQADVSTTRKYGGTGLGLTISKKFCQMMGGDILLESEYGKGSTFTIKLPTLVSTAQKTNLEIKQEKTSLKLTPSKTILVVDDDLTAQDLLKRTLSKENCQIFTANNGEEGLKLAHEIHPDLIILDVIMPVMDGWTALSRLKSDPDLSHIPVIMSTMLNELNFGYRLGADEYLTKPIERQQLKNILDKYQSQALSRLVLLVDDQQNNRNLIRYSLEKEGWYVIEADNGITALEKLKNNQPDLILLDLIMPEMDGFEFIERLREYPEWQSIPVICLTAKDLTEAERNFLNGRVENILQTYSYQPELLLQTIGSLLEKTRKEKSSET